MLSPAVGHVQHVVPALVFRDEPAERAVVTLMPHYERVVRKVFGCLWYTHIQMVLDGFKRRLLKKIGIAVGIIAILAAFLIALNIDINSRVAAISAARDELALRSRTVELLTGANSDLKRADPLFANLQSLLPDKDQLINFPRELQRVAKTYLVDAGFSFGAEKAGTSNKPGSIKFTMTIGGDFDNIIDFLKYVESHRYLISLDSVDVRRSTREDFSLLTSGDIYTK